MKSGPILNVLLVSLDNLYGGMIAKCGSNEGIDPDVGRAFQHIRSHKPALN